MQKIVIIDMPRTFPVYDYNKNKLLHWELIYKTSDNVEVTKYFRNTLLSRAYKKMCRFQRHLVLKQNENTK